MIKKQLTGHSVGIYAETDHLACALMAIDIAVQGWPKQSSLAHLQFRL